MFAIAKPTESTPRTRRCLAIRGTSQTKYTNHQRAQGWSGMEARDA